MDNQVLEEKILKKVMRNIPLGLVVSKEGRERKIYYVNRIAYEMMGYTREEYIQKVEQGWGTILDLDMRDVMRDSHEKIRNGESIEMMTSATTKSGKKKWLLNRAFVEMEGEPVCYMSIMDVTEQVELEKSRQKEQESLKELATRDSFTKLLNRGTMEELINAELNQDIISEHYAYISLDLDNFKQINDFYGHSIGDMLILELSSLLKENFEEDDYVGRMGGDEFAVFTKNAVSRTAVKERAEGVLRGLHDRKDIIGLFEEPSVSIGIAFCPEAGKSFRELYNRADEALYRVKNEAKNGIAVFN